MRRAEADLHLGEFPPHGSGARPPRRAPWPARTAAGALAASLLLVGTVRAAPPESEAAGRARLGREALEKVLEPFTYYRYPVDVHVAVRGEEGAGGSLEVPRTFPRTEGLKLRNGRIHTHRGFPGLDAEVEHLPQTYDLGWPGWGGVFVDPQGIVRARGPHDDEKRGIRLARYIEGW